MTAHLYLDASAMVKYYVAERGSAWISDLLNARDAKGNWLHVAITTLLSNVEGTCALERAYRGGRIDAATRESASRRLLLDMRHRFLALDADKKAVLRAVRLAQQYPLRAYDAVHLASALTVNDELVRQRLPVCVFISADDALLAAARAEGLMTEDPNNYP
jgi:predicted nucleic acid-binding protein